MHTFQPITNDIMDVNPFLMIGQEGMLITSGDKVDVDTTTALGGGLGVVLDKDVAYVLIHETKYIREFIEKTGTFSITFFGGEYKRELKYIGAVSGRNENKLENALLNVNYHEPTGTPFIDEGKMVLICENATDLRVCADRLIDDIENSPFKPGDNVHLFVGKIVEFLAR